MLKYCLATLLVWFVLHVNVGSDLRETYQQWALFYTERQSFLLVAAAGTGLFVYALAWLFDLLRLHSLMYVVVKSLLECSKALIALLYVGALLLYFDLGINCWKDLGLLMGIPVPLLASSLASLRLFDFNYPINDTTISCVSVPLLSATIIFVGSLAGL